MPHLACHACPSRNRRSRTGVGNLAAHGGTLPESRWSWLLATQGIPRVLAAVALISLAGAPGVDPPARLADPAPLPGPRPAPAGRLGAPRESASPNAEALGNRRWGSVASARATT